MRTLLPFLLLLAACAGTDSTTLVSGPDSTAVPGSGTVGDADTRRTTTTQATTTTHTHPPTTTTTRPIVARTVECGGWGGIVATYFREEAATACRVISCETGGTFSPTIENPRSTASGLLQFIDSTWVKARAMVGADQYARAKDAPGEVQIAAGAAWLRATSWGQWQCA